MPSLAKVREAYLAQWPATREWMGSLDETAARQPSVLAGWSVADLVAHFRLVADSIVSVSPANSGETALPISGYVGSYSDGATAISDRTKALGGQGLAEVLAEVDTSAAAASETLRASAFESATVIRARRGLIRWDDFVVTRCIELAVHSDDLDRSVPQIDGPPVLQPCLKVAVRALVNIFAARAPGRSVELRVPPYAAVQAVAGPRHTRGTPAAVVEMAPTTLLRLATGRMGWLEAVGTGSVRASGERTNLSEWLPLLS